MYCIPDFVGSAYKSREGRYSQLKYVWRIFTTAVVLPPYNSASFMSALPKH